MSIFKIPRTSQPQGPCGIDWSNPITRGLVALLSNGYDVTNNKPVGITGNIRRVSNKTGIAYKPAASDSSIWGSYHNIGTSNLTDFLLYTKFNIAYGTYQYGCGTWSGSCCMAMTTPAISGNWGIYEDGDMYSSGENAPALRGFLVHSRDGVKRRLYRDGNKVAEVANINQKGVNGVWTQNDLNPTPLGFTTDAEITISGRFARALSDAEVKSLSDNPWQLFKPVDANPQFEISKPKQIIVPSNYFTPRKSMMMGTSVPKISSSIVMPSKQIIRTSQPQSTTEVDFNNRLLRNGLLLYVPAIGNYNLFSTGDKVVDGVTKSIVSTVGGIGKKYPYGNSGGSMVKLKDIGAVNNVTYFSVFVLDAFTNWSSTFFDRNGLFGNQLHTDGYKYDWNGTDYQYNTNLPLELNKVMVCAHSIYPNKVILCVNGKSHTRTVTNGLLSLSAGVLAGTDKIIGGDPFIGSRELSGTLLMVGVTVASWSEAELISFTKNPWQLFKPVQRYTGVST